MVSKNDSPVLYMSIKVVTACRSTEELVNAEIQEFRRVLSLPKSTATDSRPVVFVVYDAPSRHFFFCSFDFEKESVLTWGRCLGRNTPDRDKWDALKIWDRMARLLGRGRVAKPQKWRGYNWKQVSHPQSTTSTG